MCMQIDTFSYHMNYEPIENTTHAFYVEFFGSAFMGFAIFALTNPKSPIPGSMVPIIIAAAYGSMVASLGALTGYVNERLCSIARMCSLAKWFAALSSVHWGGIKSATQSCERSGCSACLACDWMGSQSYDLLRVLHSRTSHWWTHWCMDC
jgi:Major intrinsic protein